MVSMTGYWDTYQLDILMQLAIEMVMTSSERPPPSMQPSHDEARIIIADC
jgi:hypothetical protein